MFQTSFRPQNEIFTTSLWPSAPTLDNYRDVTTAMPIFAILWNTFIMAITTTVAQIATGLLAAWALVRWRFPGSWLAHSLIALAEMETTAAPAKRGGGSDHTGAGHAS